MKIALFALLLCGCETHITDVLFLRDLSIMPGDLLGPAMPSLCTTANALLCDGFEEEGLTPGQPWYAVNKGAEPLLDSTHVYRGTKALRVNTDVTWYDGHARQGELTEASVTLPDDVFGRLFFYLPSPIPTTSTRIFSFLQVNNPNQGPQIYLEPNQITFVMNNITQNAAMQLPTDRWVCIELEVQAATAGYVHLWIDGTDVPAYDYSGNTVLANGLGRVSIGAAMFSGPMTQPVYSFWYDEVEIDSKRIGCDD